VTPPGTPQPATNARAPRLGRLELVVMERLWEVTEASVDEITARLSMAHRRSRNTIHSTVERLVRKGLVARQKRGRAYHYRAVRSREALLADALGALLESVPGAEPRELFATFVDLAERSGQETLDELEALIRARREGRR
jgi:predicted transcriptional regulator